MLGSVTDAEDVLQETLVAAWRSGLADRRWLYKIATNRCLNAIRDAKRRPPRRARSRRSSARADRAGPTSPGWSRYRRRDDPARVHRGAAAAPAAPDRGRRALRRARLLHGRGGGDARHHPDRGQGPAPARPRALGAPGPAGDRRTELAERFARAFADDDIDALLALLTDDAWLAMPPAPHVYQGRAAIAPSCAPARPTAPGGTRSRPRASTASPPSTWAVTASSCVDTREGGITAITRFSADARQSSRLVAQRQVGLLAPAGGRPGSRGCAPSRS